MHQSLEKRIKDVNKKIPNTSGLVKKTDYITKVTEIQNKIPDITSQTTKASLNTKVTEIAKKIRDTIGHFVNTQEFNRLTKIDFDARMK